jgi:hypothetical protein
MGIKPTDLLSIKHSAIAKDIRQPCWIDFTEGLFTFHLYNYYSLKGEKEDIQWFITDCYCRASDKYNSLFQWFTVWDSIIMFHLLKQQKICVDRSLPQGLKLFTASNPALYDDNEHFISQFEASGWEPEILERFRNDRDTVAKHSSNKKTCWGEFFG